MLSIASDADIPLDVRPGSGDRGGEGAFGFHDWRVEGLGRGAGAGVGAALLLAFSNAAILSRREPGFDFGDGVSLMSGLVGQ